jgi:cbb3-type cytochrome oxidase subunit 3
MNFMVFLLFWCVIVLGLFLIQLVWHRWRAGKPARPPEPRIALKQGETIVGVADQPGAVQFSIGTDVVDEKS